MLQAPAVCGLFAGAGGFELGLKRAGFATSALCEINPAAQAVLRSQFPSAKLHADVLTLDRIPEVQVVTAGFPCQDLSVRGAKAGIDGSRSGLVKRMFDLLADTRGAAPRWLALENVPNMLNTQNGAAMRLITGRLNDLGYRWAYRVVDARAFGLPQRRLRVILLASPVEDPCAALYADNALEEVNDSTRIADARLAYGFYWTEGQTGLGWVVNGGPRSRAAPPSGFPRPPPFGFGRQVSWERRTFGIWSACKGCRRIGRWTARASRGRGGASSGTPFASRLPPGWGAA